MMLKVALHLSRPLLKSLSIVEGEPEEEACPNGLDEDAVAKSQMQTTMRALLREGRTLEEKIQQPDFMPSSAQQARDALQVLYPNAEVLA